MVVDGRTGKEVAGSKTEVRWNVTIILRKVEKVNDPLVGLVFYHDILRFYIFNIRYMTLKNTLKLSME